MSVPTVYRWDDDNAPVLNSSAGSFVNLLRKCLVDGYGEKAGAGWTEHFVDANVPNTAFLKINGGTESFFKVVDTGGSAQLHGYEVMTSATDFIGQIGSYTLAKKQYWVIVASDKFFYLFACWNDNPLGQTFGGYFDTARSMYFAGDFIKIIDQHLNCTIGTASINTTSASRLFCMGGETCALSNKIYSSRKLTGEATTSPQELTTRNVGVNVPFYRSKGLYNSIQIGQEFDGEKLFLGRPLLFDNTEINSKGIRGFLPGYFAPSHSHDSFKNLQEIIVDGRKFLNIGFYIYYNSSTGTFTNSDYLCYNVLLEIGEDWG